MRKQALLLLVVLSFALTEYVNAQQDTIRTVIFTEWCGRNRYDAWLEITNVGTEEVDLGKFTLARSLGQFNEVDGIYTSSPSIAHQIRLSGTLAAGESFVAEGL